MIQVEPSASFEAVAKFPTGLAGTLGVRIIDNVGGTTTPRTTSGTAEYPAGSGVYAVTLTAPGSAGQYSLVWDDAAGHWAIDDLLVTSTSTAAGTITVGSLYVTRDEVKALKDISGAYDDDAIDIAVNAACRACDAYKSTQFYPTTETRYYDGGGEATLRIGEFNAITSLTVDRDQDGTYEETWVSGSDFVPGPVNAPNDGAPYSQLIRLVNAQYQPFPVGPKAVKVTGSYGWSAAPWMVKQAAVLLAMRFLTRTKSAPLGVLVAQAAEQVRMAKLGALDTDATALLDLVPSASDPSGVRSIQLS